jgi:hypothetical protein
MVKLDDVVISDVTAQKVMMGIETNRDPANLATATYASVKKAQPMFGFTSRQVAAVLDKGVSANPYQNLASWTSGYTQYMAERVTGGVYASGSTHRSFAVPAGMMICRNVSCGQEEDAVIQADILPISSNGTTLPFTIADNAALPTFDPDDDQRFTIGPWTVGNVALTGITRVSVDFGITEQWVAGDGFPIPTRCSIRQYLPTIRIEGFTAGWLAAAVIPALGVAGTQANTFGWFRKRAKGSTFVAAATAEHIKFSMACFAHIENTDSSGNEDAPATLVLEGIDDGTNAVVTIDTTSAIS